MLPSLQAALDFYRQQPFYYTLSPPLLAEQSSIDDFLFNTRRGFCEHYAGSFVYLMRTAGVPARVVLGYQGGEANEDYFIVRQSDAHAWAEVWLAGRGWVRIDPTAAVAPDRVEQGLFAAVDDTADLPLLARRDSSLLRWLALNWDALNNNWNEWVLAYNDDRQQRFLSSLGLGQIDWREMTIALLLAMGGVILVALLLYLLRQQRQCDPLARLYQRFCDKMARAGLPRLAQEGPQTYTNRIALQRPELARAVRDIGGTYEQLRYADGAAGRAEIRQLRQQINRLRISR